MKAIVNKFFKNGKFIGASYGEWIIALIGFFLLVGFYFYYSYKFEQNMKLFKEGESLYCKNEVVSRDTGWTLQGYNLYNHSKNKIIHLFSCDNK